MFIKFAIAKWLPIAIVTSGLSLFLYIECNTLANHVLTDTAVLHEYIHTLGVHAMTAWIAIMFITFLLQLYGEYRHSQAIAAQKRAA